MKNLSQKIKLSHTGINIKRIQNFIHNFGGYIKFNQRILCGKGLLANAGRSFVIRRACFVNDFSHPATHTEQVRVESIFAITVAALTP